MNQKYVFTLILFISLSAPIQADQSKSIMESIKNYLIEKTEFFVNKYREAIKLVPTPMQAYGNTIYVCGAEDCDFCFLSRQNSIAHVVKCHFLAETTVKERFEQYPQDDEALRLAFSKSIEDSYGASILKSMAQKYVDIMGVDAVEALFEINH